jgi:RNA polymerase sigma-70 factor (ECF subfamily)
MHDGKRPAEDSELVRRTLAGEREAFGELYDRYARLVRAVASDASYDEATIQDIVQECFLRAFRQLPSLQQPTRFRFWIVGIARRLIWENRRRRLPEPLCQSPPGRDETRLAEDHDETSHVLQLVRRLPEQERLAVHFFFLSDRNIEETAELLGLSRSGAYAMLKRACTKLARWLGADQPEREVRP